MNSWYVFVDQLVRFEDLLGKPFYRTGILTLGLPMDSFLAESSIHEVSMHEVIPPLVLCFRDRWRHAGTCCTFRPSLQRNWRVFVFPNQVKAEQTAS